MSPADAASIRLLNTCGSPNVFANVILGIRRASCASLRSEMPSGDARQKSASCLRVAETISMRGGMSTNSSFSGRPPKRA